MHAHRHQLILLPANRVWRTYPGGRTLDQLAGVVPAQDSHLAEDWIASTTRAVNPGRESIQEGVSHVQVGHETVRYNLADLLERDPEYFLGAAHVAKYGAQPQLLVKFLDSGTRLHFQVHPTREFAQRVLGASSGKTEAYHVLAVRPESRGEEASGYIYVGFQRPPSAAELRDYIVTQNIAAIESCFDRIQVKPGDTFIIPGGTPHALGAGVFMVEVQEPSDLVIRFEFARAGYVLPAAARFMRRDVDFALPIFNWAPLTPDALAQRVRCQPQRRRTFDAGSFQDELIGARHTDCFRINKTHLAGRVVKHEHTFTIAIVTAGTITADVGGERHRLQTYDKVLLPAGLGPVTWSPENGPAELLECYPPI